MTSRVAPAAALGVAFLSAVTPSALSQDAATSESADAADFSSFVGRYRNDSVDAARTTIEDAIVRGTEAMPALRRNVGRRRLRAVNKPVQVLRIVVEGDRLVTDFDGDRYAAYVDGRPLRGRDPEGKPVTVSYRASGHTLHARFVGEDGEKRIDFVRGEGSRLTLEATITSDQLPAPIRYRVPYSRQ